MKGKIMKKIVLFSLIALFVLTGCDNSTTPPVPQIEINVPEEFVGVYKADGVTGILDIQPDEIYFDAAGLIRNWNETIAKNFADSQREGFTYDYIFEERYLAYGNYSLYIRHMADGYSAVAMVTLTLSRDKTSLELNTYALDFNETEPKIGSITLAKIL